MVQSWMRRIETLVAPLLLKLPGWLLVLLSGGRPKIRDGQRLHPQIQFIMAARAMGGQPMKLQNGAVEASRKHMLAASTQFTSHVCRQVQTRDFTLETPAGALPAKLYSPAQVDHDAPVMLFFHGGGFVLGSIESHDAPCRVLAQDAAMHVLSVEYRLAPEAPFPAGVEDAVASYRYLLDHPAELGISPRKIFVGGDSAGANIATVLCYLAREQGLPQPDFQLLIYPVTDAHNTSSSRKTLGEGLFLENHAMDWFTELYTDGNEALTMDPRCSPIFIENFSGLAPAHVVTAALDPLRDEGEALAKRLQEAGVRATHHREPGLIHGFINMLGIAPVAHEATDRIITRVREAAAWGDEHR